MAATLRRTLSHKECRQRVEVNRKREAAYFELSLFTRFHWPLL